MATFGVAEVQVRRDHAISHILAALSRHRRQELIFFGGTALSRTYLLDERLSEDIDLIAVDQRDGGCPEFRGTSVAARCSSGYVHGLIMTVGTDTLLGDMPLQGGP